MYLMYVDESGDPGLGNSPVRYFTLSGLILHELRWAACLEELIAFRRELKALFGLKLREEIHAGHMLAKPGELARIPKHQRLEILRRYADKLAALDAITVINVVVDKQGKPPAYRVFDMAWQALIQRFENGLTRGTLPGPRQGDERGMLFPDRTDEKQLRLLLRRMRAYNPVPSQAAFGGGYRNLQLRYIIEDASHRDSDSSYFIQSADLCAFLLYQHFAPNAYMKAKSGQNYFKRLDPISYKPASFKRPDGIVLL